MSSLINIQPIPLDLRLGTASKVKIQINYEIGSTDVILQLYYFDESNVQLATGPVLLAVPQEVLDSWDLDFVQIIRWALKEIGATPT